MFHRDRIVSLKIGDRFIAKEYQSRNPLRDKYLCLFSPLFLSLRDKDPNWWSCLAFQKACFLNPRIEFEYSQWLSRPKGSFSSSLTPFNHAKVWTQFRTRIYLTFETHTPFFSKGLSGIWNQDLSHPKQDSYPYRQTSHIMYKEFDLLALVLRYIQLKHKRTKWDRTS